MSVEGVQKDVEWQTVSQLTERIKAALGESPYLRNTWVRGEVSNLTRSARGHIYFSLKDANSTLACSYFSGDNRYLNFPIEEGQELMCFGSIDVFGPQGKYSLIVRHARRAGMGELRLRIEELKKKLRAEGLFEAHKKKSLPFFPRRIGVATSATGAALRDILRVVHRRNPYVKLVLAPCLVQGDMAAETIVRALEVLAQPKWNLDLIICGRGGGSFEDLLAFSDEKLVRAVAACPIPIISAVGHQVDHPLCDEAADYAAPTPSAAAEAAVPEAGLLESRLQEVSDRLEGALGRGAARKKDRLADLFGRPVWQNVRRIVDERTSYLDELEQKLHSSVRTVVQGARNELMYTDKLAAAAQRCIGVKKTAYLPVGERLSNFSPLATLNRGFGIVRNESMSVVTTASSLNKGDSIEVVLADGRARAEVKEIEQIHFDSLVAREHKPKQ